MWSQLHCKKNRYIKLVQLKDLGYQNIFNGFCTIATFCILLIISENLFAGTTDVPSTQKGSLSQPAISTEVSNWLRTPEYNFNYSDLRNVKRPLLISGIITSGAGISLIAASVPLFIIDGTCSSLSTNSNGQCVSLHQTKPVAIGLLSGGAALAVTGMILMIVRRKYRQKLLKKLNNGIAK